MARKTPTETSIAEQLASHGIEFGKRYRDPHSLFEGVATAFHFYQHGCLRVTLRGTNRSTGEATELGFDAPELVLAETAEPVPPSSRPGGPGGLGSPARTGLRS